ncbi:hypothetical protein JCM6882_001704 [Rhodosporidiobolus microsporus]
MWDIVRDSTFGQLLNYFSGGRFASYPEQLPSFVPPPHLNRRDLESRTDTPVAGAPSDAAPPATAPAEANPVTAAGFSPVQRQQSVSLLEAALTRTRSRATIGAVEQARSAEAAKEEQRQCIVWAERDPDRPMNWSMAKKSFVAFQIALYTFSIYVAAAIYTPGIPMISEEFDVSLVVATLGLSLFVFGYGLGPMLLSPLQESPQCGRTHIYIAGLALFVLFQMPSPIAGDSLPVLLVFRFLSGFVGSPALATGGATMTDIFPPSQQAMAIAVWAMGASMGPLLGPPLSGYAVQLAGWRWSFYETLFLAGFTLALTFFFLPETLESTILLRRARRVRKATGNPKIKTGCELNNEVEVGLRDLLWINAKRVVQLSLEPAILVANIHLALVYAILFTFFESFPIVFSEIHGFSIGATGLAFLCFAVTAPFVLWSYYIYQKRVMEPRMFNPKPGRPFQPEMRLEIGIFAGFLIFIALIIFGWTGRNESVHWFWPMFGAAFYFPGIYFTFQSILLYVGSSFPSYAASIFAGNDFFRSCFAAPFPLFARAFFSALGIGGGNTFLAVASLGTTGFLYLIYRYGERLRARSRFTG